MQSGWAVQWQPHAPECFAVGAERSAAILHGIEGLDPHDPLFVRERCYLWRVWHCVTVRDNGHVFIRTPGRRDQCTQSLRGLLAFHCLGAMERPSTSSRLACPCGQGRTYGECCCPTVAMVCGSSLCVNPLHMRVGRARTGTENSNAVAIEVPILPACPSCAQCGWTPFGLHLTARIRGYHETACTSPLRLDAAGRATLEQWRTEALETQVGRSVAGGASESDARHARLYLMRSRNKLAAPLSA
jgi:hypothetical protein